MNDATGLSLAQSGSSLAQLPADLTTCDRELIHLPGGIQPHGVLLITDDANIITHATKSSSEHFGISAATLLGRTVSQALGEELEAVLARVTPGQKAEHVGTRVVGTQGKTFTVLVHRNPTGRVIEFERADTIEDVAALYAHVRRFAERLQGVNDPAEIARRAAEQVRVITGFDRVLVYRFDADWNGTTIAEDKASDWPPYLDLRFPASDIPQQARELYRVNRIRLIATANYTPAPIVAVTGASDQPVDLSFSVLRSVSPVHLEYCRNMGAFASMSVSIMRGNQLWGLIACHHGVARFVPYEARNACDSIGQIFSLQLEAREGFVEAEHRTRLRGVLVKLLAAMAEQDDFVEGLRREQAALLEYADAAGAAVAFAGRIHCFGTTPAESDVQRVVDFVDARSDDDVFATDHFTGLWPDAEALKSTAAGVLAVSVSKLHSSYVLWFRPEVIQTAKWAGDPRKPVDPAGERIHPRKSFEAWKQTLRLRSLPWKAAELDAAAELRNAIIGIVLRRAEELAEMAAELERSNKELEAFSYSVSHDLRAPFRHISGFAELIQETEQANFSDRGKRYLNNVIESAQYAGRLVDNLLHFSQMGRTELVFAPVNMPRLVEEVIATVKRDIASGHRVQWRIGEVLSTQGDSAMLRLVWQNLLSNAVKYSRDRDPAVITLGCRREGAEVVYFVSDNGAGFDMKYIDKLFGVFQRLHRMEDFEGTGIGLANVRRIVNRHGGRTWAHGVEGQGATFYFSLPFDPRTV